MDGAYVVAVGTVLHLKFPVAVVDIGGVAAQHLDAVGRSIDDLVDHGPGGAKMFFERHDIGIEASEQESPITLEPWNSRQIMRTVCIERRRIVPGLSVLHLQELASVAEGPAVERTGETALFAVLAPAEDRSAVSTRIDHGVQFARFVACDHDRLAADPGAEIVVVVRYLALMRQENPIAFEDVLHLQLVHLDIGEDVTTATEQSELLVFDHRA